MRKCLPAVFASLALAFSISIVAYGSSGTSPSQFCDAHDNEGSSHSTCVVCMSQGAFDTPPVFTPTCSCEILQDAGVLEENGFDNLGDCISSGFVFVP